MPAGEPRPPAAPLQPDAVGREGGPFDSVWPSPTQELLLDAALARGDRALAAWRAWAAEGRLDRTDRVSRRLLPFVYGNLSAQGLDDPLLGRLREFYLATWKRAQDLLRALERALRVLNAAGIETLLLKGAALAPFYYDDEGVRWLGDLDVLVPTLNALRSGAVAAELREVATAGREATKPMLATRGRASFLGERSIGHYDPGATSSCLLIHAVCDALEDAA